MTDTCPTCGLPVQAYARGVAYADTPGGHADRHTLVVEAADRALRDDDERTTP